MQDILLLTTGFGSQTHPHLHVVASHMEHVFGKRPWLATDWPTIHPTPNEADLNLLWKWYSSMGFIKIVEQLNNLLDSQHGGWWADWCTINLACKQIATFSSYHITWKCACKVSNNAWHCFDCMCENCQNLSCRQQGVTLHYLKLHANPNKVAIPCETCMWHLHTLQQSFARTSMAWSWSSRCSPKMDSPSRQHDAGIPIQSHPDDSIQLQQ